MLKRTRNQILRVDPIARSIEQTRRAMSTMTSTTPGYAELQSSLAAQIKALAAVDSNFHAALMTCLSDMVADKMVGGATDALLDRGARRDAAKVFPLTPAKTRRKTG